MSRAFIPCPDTPGVSGTSRVIAGRFRLGELLGTGGSASVFAAVDERTGLQVALKVLHPHLSERPAAREAFLAEARRAQPLRHPNIVGVLGVGVDREGEAPVAWIALDLADGSTLSRHVSTHGPLPPAQAVAVADGVLRALEAAHAIGLIHRDVSPSNVMVAPDAAGAVAADGVRLLDFGLADAAGTAALGTDDLLSVDARGRAGVMGNVNYMSPEQVRGMPVDARGDVYQVGALLHFALTGRPPFPRDTTGQTLRAHLETPPPSPSDVDAHIPRGLDRIVLRAMLKDPADRFPSAVSMRAAVAALDLRASATSAAPVITSGVTDAATPVASDARAGEPEGTKGGASVPSDERDGVTRVLGRTVVPPRREASVVVDSRPWRRARSGAGAWLAAVAAAVVFAIVVVLAAVSPPTASVARPSVSAPAPAPSSAPSVAQPEPEPRRVEPVVSLTAIPELAGLSVGEAMRALADQGFVTGEISHVDSPHERDVVLATDPPPGRRLAEGAAVALTVASGWNAVPDVAGQSRDAAAAAVEAAGFVASFVTGPAPAGTAPGSIVGTAPGAGTGTPVGATVTIIEADPDDPRPTPTPTAPGPTPTPTPTLESRA